MLRRAAVIALVVPVLLPLVGVPAAASETRQEIVHLLDADGDGTSAVVLRDLETRRTTPVLNDDGASTDQEPELSPDGGRIALSTDRVSGGEDLQIAVVSRDGSGLRALTTPTADTATATIDVSPAWFPDGQRILFSRVAFDVTTGDFVGSDLYVVPADGSAPEQPLRGGEDAFAGDVDSTGTRIAFVLVDERFSDGEGRLGVLRTDFNLRELLPAHGYDPSWSPTQNLLAFTTTYERDPDPDRGFDGTQVATIVPPPGGSSRVQPLHRTRGGTGTARTSASRAEWAPDGQSIVYARAGFDAEGALPADLWAVDVRGGRVGALAATAADEFDPHWQGPAPSSVSAGTPSGYVPVEPQRVLDTRDGTGTGGSREKVGPGGTVRLQVRGLETSAGPLPQDASAVVLNVTVTQPDASTDVRVFPSGAATPTVSNVNVVRGATVPNLVTAAIGSDGAVVLRNNSGSVHLLADLAGFYRTEGGLGFRAVDPARILDTRNGTGAPAGRVGAGQVRDVRVTGTLTTADGGTVEIPTTAQAVVLNVTGTGVSRSTDVRVYPTRTGGAVPEVSNLNLRTGETAANLVTVPVGEGGRIRLRNNSGQTHLLADIAGYYTSSTTSVSRFVPVDPTRFLDTRIGIGAAPVPTGADQRVDLQVGGFRGVPADATAVVTNLTATGVSANTDVRAFPQSQFGGETPTVSNLNLQRGATRANLAVVRLGGDGRLLVRNNSGTVHLLADVAGYFVPAA